MANYKNTLKILDRYKGYAITAVVSALLTGLIVSSRSHKPLAETEDLQPYPASSRVYQIEGVNEGRPILRVKMSDGKEEILNADDAEAKTYTSIRDLERKDVDNKRQYWTGLRRDITGKMREADFLKSK